MYFPLAVNVFDVVVRVNVKTGVAASFGAADSATQTIFTFGVNSHLFSVEFVLDGVFAFALLDHD